MLLRRFTLIFYRISTYQRLVKILLVMGYALGLSAFFGFFIASDKNQQEPDESGLVAPNNNHNAENKTDSNATPETAQPVNTTTTSEQNQTSHPISKTERYNHAVKRVRDKLEKHLGPEKTQSATKIANRTIDDLEHSRIVTHDQAEKLRIPLQ